MVKKKYVPPIKATRRSVRVLVPGEGKGGEYAETSLHEEYLYDPYLATSRSEGGRRFGALQFARRTKSGKYKRKQEWEEPDIFGKKFKGVEGTGGFSWSFDRDSRLLICIGIVIVVFIVMYSVMAMVFDVVGDMFGFLSLDPTDFNTFRLQASLAFGVVVALIVGSGAAMFFFKEEDVDDAMYEA